MSRYSCWDYSSFRNISGFGHVRSPSPHSPPQIACRLCDQIFMSSRALIHHLESHMTEDGTVSTRQPEINFISRRRDGNDSINQLPSNLAFPTVLKEIRPAVQNCYSQAVPAGNHITGTGRFDFPSAQLPMNRSNNYPLIPFVQPAKQRVTTKQQLRDDFIKPYIDMLDKPIPETVELIESDDDEKKLDLTLKL